MNILEVIYKKDIDKNVWCEFEIECNWNGELEWDLYVYCKKIVEFEVEL